MVVALRIEARMVAKSTVMPCWRMHGIWGPRKGFASARREGTRAGKRGFLRRKTKTRLVVCGNGKREPGLTPKKKKKRWPRCSRLSSAA